MKEKNNNINIIPAKFKLSKINGQEQWILIFNFSDFVSDRRPAEFQEEISKELDETLEKIKKIIPDGKPSKVKRQFIWDIGNLILEMRDKISEKYGIYITNIVEAVAVKLGISPRTVNFFVQFRETIHRDEIDNDIPWKVYQIALLLKDKSKLKECVELYKKGALKNTTDVLKYVQQCNKNI